MRPRMPSGRARPSVGRSGEQPRRAAGALATGGGDVALVARDKTVLEAAREAVSAASCPCGTWCLP
jgi:short-subunit dehydrogenase